MGIIVANISDYSRYETFSTAATADGRDFHIVGELSRPDEMYYDPEVDPNYFSFYLKDKAGEERKVVFKGTKPTDFERSEQIVLTGRMQGNEFHASKILMKCPSKYINDQLEVTEVKATGS
ncbi:MAG: hypothetical protein KatS3mg031_0560 [Chitinophagales bacterium]|nr:MAG: hypothetical protein KatS3mg031_0560 [Chitinophagales bacterium]